MTIRARSPAGCACLTLAILATACERDEGPDNASPPFQVSVFAEACPGDWQRNEDCSRVPVPDARVVVSAGARVVWEGRTDERGEALPEVPPGETVVVSLSSELFDFELEREATGMQPPDAVRMSFYAPDLYVLERHERHEGEAPD
jgi:hypothetical protein